LGAWLMMWLLRPLATLVHELGHALAASIFTDGQVTVRVGEGGGYQFQLANRIKIDFLWRNGQEGATTYFQEDTQKGKKIIILLSGPFFSFISGSFVGWFLFFTIQPVWVELPMISWFCCNALVFLRAIVPMRLKPTDKHPDGPKSDGLQIINLLRER